MKTNLSNRTRYIVVMLLCAALNILLYHAAHVFHLPLWMDMQGTVLAAIVLEPVAGLLVGLVQSFLEAIFYYDVSSIIYFGVSASAALIAGLFLKKEGKICKKRILPAMGLMVVVTALISTLLTFWRSGGVPDSTWERHFYDMAMSAGVPQFLSSYFGIMVLKIGDAIEIALVVTLVYLLLPKVLKTEPVIQNKEPI